MENEVNRLIRITRTVSDGQRVLFHGILQPGASSEFPAIESALAERGLDIWMMEKSRGQALVVLAPAHPVISVRQRPMLSLALLVATLATTTWAGAMHHGVDVLREPTRWAVGLPYAAALLLILGVHEMGHYLIARRNGVRVTLPYFIPAPFFLGTFGAFIRMGGRIRDRRVFFDVAVAGPLAGLAVAVLAILVGTGTDSTAAGHGMDPSSSLLFAGLYRLAGGTPVTQSVQLGPVAFAGWLGLLVTALNLAPIGQLDGGHIAYALFGRVRARAIAVAVLALMVAAGLLYSSHWLTWAFIVYFIAGTDHPVSNNEVIGLGPGRKALGYLAFVLLAAIIFPVPG